MHALTACRMLHDSCRMLRAAYRPLYAASTTVSSQPKFEHAFRTSSAACGSAVGKLGKKQALAGVSHYLCCPAAHRNAFRCVNFSMNISHHAYPEWWHRMVVCSGVRSVEKTFGRALRQSSSSKSGSIETVNGRSDISETL